MNQYVPGTTPYPWPYDGDLTSRGTALVLLAGTGSPPPPDDLVTAVGTLALAVRRSGSPIILVTNVLPGRGPGTAVGMAGSAPGQGLLGDLVPDNTVAAGGFNAFYASDLDLILRTRGIQRLLLAGCNLETSVHSTMRDANDRGYECLLVVDACSPGDPALVPAAVSMIEMSGGIFGAVGRTSAVLRALATASVAASPAPAPSAAIPGVPAAIQGELT